MARRIRLAGVALEDEARDARDLAELTARELGGVQAREDVGVDSGRREQATEIADRERHGRRGQEAEAVVVGGEAERARHFAREAVAQERREPDVREPSFERVEEEAVAFARDDAFDQPFVLRRQVRPAALQLEQRPHERHFGRRVLAALRRADQPPCRRRELRRERHLAARPARDLRRIRFRGPHPRGQLAHAHELEHAAREHERSRRGRVAR